MDFLPPGIDDYAQQHTSAEPAYLTEITRDTYAHVLYPRMLSGHLQGRFLSFISHMLRPSQVLEIGTFTGYSALCFAEGLAPNGKITTIDVNEELETRILKNFALSPFAEQIDLKIGNAIDIIPDEDGPFDLVFLDADKVQYQAYFDLILPKVRQGGVLLVDNVLWSGKVIDEGVRESDKDTWALKRFNDYVMEHKEVENCLLPLRDGVMMVRKV